MIEGILAEGCTLLVPTFSWVYQARPPQGRRPAQNSFDYDRLDWAESRTGLRYMPDNTEIDADMGIIPATVLRMPGRVRGEHPLCSVTAIGPLARDLISGQAPLDVNAPLMTLAEFDGLVILMGVGLERMTLIHAAEQLAGRNLFRRWASSPDGETLEVETGGCSEGFGNLRSALAPVTNEVRVGESTWLVFNAQSALAAASCAIVENPSVTHCSRPDWHRCDDAILGGPIL